MEWTRGRTIGRGSSATVSAATCLNSGEILAVKSADLSRSSEFLRREAEILSSLSSPYVVGYRGCETTKESNGVAMFNLLMEYAPYGTLTHSPAKNGGRVEEKLLVKYTRQILRGLEYIHSMGITHCDVKGSNVLIGESGVAKIADFGCAKRVDPEPDLAEPIRGTPAFMAPEVARGERQGKESDIWAVGCTVIEMATGSPPWVTADAGGDPVSVLYRVGYLGESPEIPCFLTEQAKDFLKKCFKRQPEKRWTASQLLNHPFLTKPNSEPTTISGSISGPISNSPTSVMDQRLWVSVEEEAEEDPSDDLGRIDPCGSHGRRIGRLCLVGSGGPTWDMEGGDWIMVRNGTMIGGSDGGMMISENIESRSEIKGFGEMGRLVFSESLHLGGDQCGLSVSHQL